MNIIKQSRELNKYDLYELTQSSAIRSMKNCEDRRIIVVEDYVLYTDEDRKGNPIELIAVMDKATGDVFASQSATFKEGFLKAIDFVEEDDTLYIRVLHGKSKNGREFINCALVSPKIAERELTPFGK